MVIEKEAYEDDGHYCSVCGKKYDEELGKNGDCIADSLTPCCRAIQGGARHIEDGKFVVTNLYT